MIVTVSIPPAASPSAFDVLIVGAGHAGAQAAIGLRQKGFAGSIALLGEEHDLPYERPPLSKDYLCGDKSFERILLKPASFWGGREITLRLGHKVTAVDPVGQSATLADGSSIVYGTLIWATGGRVRRLTCSGQDAIGVHAIRTRADVDRLLAELPECKRVCVIGGGYIGLEAAAALTKLGKPVTIVEAMDRVLARVAGEPLSRFYEDEHRRHGVDVRLGAQVECIEVDGGRVAGIRLAGGEVLPADLAIVGIGIIPEVQQLLAAGAAGDNGVLVDDRCATSLANIYAIGDCAQHANAFANGATIRLESVQNANDMAAVVAHVLTSSAPIQYHAVPWFWSNQFDLRLQTVGLSLGYDRAVLRGDPAERSFSVVYLREGRVVALDCVNRTRDFVQGRALVMAGTQLDPDFVADSTIPLKELLVAA